MKKYIKTIITICAVGFTFLACEKEEISTFSGKNLIYFQWSIDGKDYESNKIDSTSITFAFDLPTEKTDSLVSIPVKIQGKMSPQDRSVAIRIMGESTVENGVHFNMSDNIIIPANEVIGYIPVTFNRTEDMKEQEFLLKLELLENENFGTNIWGTEKSNSTNKTLSYTEFEITISDILTEPEKWYMLGNWLGDFSAKKFYLFAEVNQMPLPNYNELPNLGDFFGQIAIMKAYLAAQKNAGTPVLEEDGSEMTLGRYA